MKKYLFSIIFLLVSYVGFSQKGLSYQAVILDPNAIEVPGQDITGHPFVNGDVWIKFSIYNGSTLQFEEVQKTRTDAYGLVNLMIGSVSTASFNALVWDASQKTLQVYVSFNQGGSYTKVSDQKLTYSPYTLFAETAGKLGGVLGITGGGTGATTVADARLNLGLDQVNNTSDAAKPVSTATKAALDLKANVADVNAALAAKADTGVIKAYVDSKIVSSNSTSSNQSSSTSTISTAALALKANTVDVNLALAAKADTAYVITKVAAATIVDADANTKGKIQLAGDLAGTAAAPTIPALALKANAADLVTLTSVVTANTASITANSTAVTTEATTARAAELVLTNNVAANTASITANTNAILLKAPIASPIFTGTVAIGTANPSSAAALDITSTSKGLLLPRLTFAQKSAIISPEAGLILWCSDCGTNGELQVYNGTNFVNMVGANAQFALPTISATSAASAITSSALTSGGSIDSDGGAFVTARGVVWNTSTNPTVSLSTKTTDGTGIGTFSSSISGLTSGVTYYVRAYATNSVGTKYGPEITVNTAQAVATLASTTAASSIGATSANSGGNITYNGGATVTVSGLVWSTSSNPTIALTTKTSNGSSTGTFTSNITGLTPGTLYYVRSYATNNVGTSYGAEMSFTTLNTPTISSTTAASSITSSSAISGGTISADGGDAVTTRGIVYGTSAGSSTYSVTSGSGTGTFTSNLTGLTPATTYYVRSFATNSVGTVYGTETNFTTVAIAPTLTTTAASSITKYAATLGGTITSNGGSVITVSGICWSTSATPTTSDSKTTDGTTSGTFTSSITGLTAGTTYFVRAYATNAIGTSYGVAQSFTTLSTAPAQTTVLIGTQRWTDKNLNVANYRNGDAITYAANAAQWAAANAAGEGAYTYLKYASGDGGATYGKLYNWYAVNDSRGLAPTGYHIPTRDEWTTLRGTQPENGKTLKSNTTDWSASFNNVNNYITFIPDANYSNYNGTNSTGFNALPGGSLFPNGTNGNYGSASLWTATIDPLNSAKANWTYFHSTTLYDGANCCGTYELGNGMSVRLVKDDNSIEASPTNPVLAFTTTATSITSSSAILGGNVTDEGATQVSARGLVYGTTTGSSTFSVTIGSGAGTFTSTLTGLSQGTTYYVRSFATNTQGTSYGAETSFTTQTIPTVSVTATPTSLRTTSAVGGGTISSTGGATITTSGLVWDASTNPTIALSTKTTDGTTSGTFTSSITGLTQGATYHVRAYATNYLGTSYGPDVTFTTITTPTISSTATVTSITGTTATGGGTITADGGAEVTARGVVYGTSSLSSTYSVTSGTGTGTYTIGLTGLTPATTYFIRSFVTNSVGTVYGTETSFTTIAVEPTVSATAVAASITGSSATSGGTISSNGGSIVTESGIVWSTTSTPTIALSTKTTNVAATGTYTSSITGLAPATLYYVRAYATNSIGTAYGPQINFTTLAIAPTISATATVTSITGTTATSGGTITVDGGASVTSRGIVWGTTTGSSTYSVTSGTGTGTYTANLSGLIPATTYYVRAFATNGVGTVYGPETSFTSTATAPIISTIAASSITQNSARSGGTITSNGGSTITASGICWSTSATPTIANSKTTDGTTSGTFTSSMTGLALGTTYYVRAYATNAIGTGYGAAQSFTTLPFENVPTASNPVTNGLMLYLDATRSESYSGSGTTWADISGLSPAGDATLVGSPSFGSSSLANGSGSFTFSSNKYGITSKTYTIDNEITYIAWVNPSESISGGVIVRRTGSDYTSGATSLYLYSNNLGYDWNNSKYGWRSNLMVPNNQWSMIVITVNASTVTAYLCNTNGITSASNGTSHESLTSRGAAKFHIAYDPYDIPNRAVKGKMGTAMVYSVALSSADITAIFNAQKASFGL